MTTGLYTTSVNKCVIPHYTNYNNGSVTLPENKIFEAERGNYDKYGDRLSGAVSGICMPDLFSNFGLVSHEGYVKDLFYPLPCVAGRDIAVSFLVANPPYDVIDFDKESKCPKNIVFRKGCLIVPRGELIWALLALDADKIGNTGGENNDEEFKIYITQTIHQRKRKRESVETGKPENEEVLEPIPINVGDVQRQTEELKSHYNHLRAARFGGYKSIKVPNMKYVYLNPAIYNRIRSFRCISPVDRTLVDQDYMLFAMNLLYVQSLSMLALLSTLPNRLLQYPPGTKETICHTQRNTMSVVIPIVDNIAEWTIHQQMGGYAVVAESIPNNVVLIADVVSNNTCESRLSTLNHNIIQALEKEFMGPVRHEHQILKGIQLDCGNLTTWYDIEAQQFWKKLIANSYPSKIMAQGEVLTSYTPNCLLTPLGIVATKDICENDPIIVKESKLDLKNMRITERSGWHCDILPQDFTVSSQLDEQDKAGPLKQNDPRIQKNPLNYSPSFVSSMGTNFSILSD